MSAHPIVHWELMGEDPAKLKSFYSTLFGWALGPVEGFDNYYVTTGEESGVGGAVGTGPEVMRNYSALYFTVESIDDSLTTVEANGGTVIIPRTIIPDVVVFGLFSDPAGNVVGIVEEEVPEAS